MSVPRLTSGVGKIHTEWRCHPASWGPHHRKAESELGSSVCLCFLTEDALWPAASSSCCLPCRDGLCPKLRAKTSLMLLLGGVLSRSHIEEPIPPPAAFIPPEIVCPPPQLPVPALDSVLSGLWDPCLALDVHPLLVIFIGNNFSLRAFYFVHNALVEHKFLFSRRSHCVDYSLLLGLKECLSTLSWC